LARALGEVRSRGWASEAEEYLPGEAAIAAPIRGHGGLVLGAIGVSGAVDRVLDGSQRPRAGLVAQVSDAARAVSRALDDTG
jgi:DNA-binding IclR family transcriptional regulator